MRRREFLAGIGALAMTAPIAVRAQQAAKLPKIAVVTPTYPDDRLQVLKQALADAGYIDGKTASVQFFVAATLAGSDTQVDAALATKPDLIITLSSPGPLTLKARGTTIPVVFATIADPVAIGLARSYAHPDGNFTGAMQGLADIVPKQFQIMRDVLPTARRVAALSDPTDPPYGPITSQIATAAKALGFETVEFPLKDGQDLAAMVAQIADGGFDAIYGESLNLVSNSAGTIAPLALGHELPLIGGAPGARLGALVGYTADNDAIIRSSIPYVDDILKNGKKPGDLPIIEPEVFDFVVNLKTAKALGITVPPSVLVQATEVIS